MPDPTRESAAPSHDTDRVAELARRLAFLELTTDDAEQLRGKLASYRAFAGHFVERFYEHLLAFPESARFLDSPARIERLKALQRDHFESLLAAQWDAEFVERRYRVGARHAEVGIEPEYFLGAYNQYLRHCLPEFWQKAQEGDPPEWLMPLLKAVFLDIGLTLDVYFEQATRHLRDALDILWKANAEVRDFARLTSHDLKTPLATVANLCDEALDEFGAEMPKGASELVRSARDGVYRMSRLIDELLSSTVAPSSTEAHDDVWGGAVIDEAVERIKPLLAKKEVAMTLPSDVPMLWGNRVRLREAFYNVLSNAVKFIDKRPGRIEVTCRREGDVARFAIRDNGPGIPAEELERVFVPFRRLPQHRLEPGSGLGLYFTKMLIESEGGRVWAESQRGEGSCFYIEVPCQPEARPDAGPTRDE